MSTHINQHLIDEVVKNYPNNYAQDIAKALNISISKVYYIANKNGIKKSPEFLKMELQRQGERLKSTGSKNRFNNGHIPFNKGKKVSEEVYKAMSRTMFKKDSVPVNIKYDGHERIDVDGYTHVRVSKGKYVLKHRKLWEDINGTIPNGYALVFKDGNKRNITIENLELITRRELMQRNTIQRYPEEIKSTLRTLKKLKRIINEKQD